MTKRRFKGMVDIVHEQQNVWCLGPVKNIQVKSARLAKTTLK